jgi:hypothetical protein
VRGAASEVERAFIEGAAVDRLKYGSPGCAPAAHGQLPQY